MASFAEANHIPVVPLKAADRNIEVMKPYLDRAAATGRSQAAAIGVAQEPQRVFIARKRDTDPSKPPQFSFDMKNDRRVTVYYFYLWDAGFGPAFHQGLHLLPLAGQGMGQRPRAGQSSKPVSWDWASTGLSNGSAACDGPGLLQRICDSLQPGTIEVFFQRWLHRLPLPLAPAEQTPAGGGNCRWPRSRYRAPSCSPSPGTPAASLTPWSPATSTSDAPTPWRSSSTGRSATARSAPPGGRSRPR